MDTLERKIFVSSSDFTAENILYYGANITVVLATIGLLVSFYRFICPDYDMFWPELIHNLILYVSVILTWAVVMLALKVTNFLRHIYNRLDDSVLDGRGETSPEVEEEEKN